MAHLGDAWTTASAAGPGSQFRELNPIVRPVLERWGFPGLVVFKSAYIAVLWFTTENKAAERKEQERFLAFLLGMLATVNNAAEISYNHSPGLLRPSNLYLGTSTPGVT